MRANPSDYDLDEYIISCHGCDDLDAVPKHQTLCEWTTDEKTKLECREAEKCETGSQAKLHEPKSASCKVVPCDPKCSENGEGDFQMYAQCCATCLENACSDINERQICRGCAPDNAQARPGVAWAGPNWKCLPDPNTTNLTPDKLYRADAKETSVAAALASALPAWLLPSSGIVLLGIGALAMGRRASRINRSTRSLSRTYTRSEGAELEYDMVEAQDEEAPLE